MDENKPSRLREEAKNWTCNHLSITNHAGDAAGLLRKVADAIEQLGQIDILDITYGAPLEPPILELTMTVYFTLRSQA